MDDRYHLCIEWTIRATDGESAPVSKILNRNVIDENVRRLILLAVLFLCPIFYLASGVTCECFCISRALAELRPRAAAEQQASEFAFDPRALFIAPTTAPPKPLANMFSRSSQRATQVISKLVEGGSPPLTRRWHHRPCCEAPDHRAWPKLPSRHAVRDSTRRIRLDTL